MRILITLALTLSLSVAIDAATPGPISALTYTNVGGSGTYQQVVNMQPGVWPSCTSNIAKCVQQTKSVSGPLAPFDDEITLVFSGPMNLYNIGVYQLSGQSGSWGKVSSWTLGSSPSNLVFMANMGGQVSGEWDVCGGSSQSYVNGDWTAAAASPNQYQYTGWLQDGNEINIMTAQPCSSSSPCSGFSRGTANHGWANSKIFAIDLATPYNGDDGSSVWALNAQIVRSAQYGCNCRGMGSPGGCGELDLIETLSASNHSRLISEIYSFKGATGTGSNYWWDRPVVRQTLLAIFSVENNLIHITMVPQGSFSFPSTLSASDVAGILAKQDLVVPFN